MHAGALTYELRLQHELLGACFIARLEVETRKAIVTGIEQLWLAGLLRERERLGVVVERRARRAVALFDLGEDDERHGEMVQLAEASIQLDRGTHRADAVLVAAVGQRAV